MDLEQEAKTWMKEKSMYGITAKAYQIAACETAIFPKEKALEYITLGLTGEAGEIANKVKKLIRDGADIEMIVGALIHDLGDDLAPVNHSQLAAAIIRPYVRS